MPTGIRTGITSHIHYRRWCAIRQRCYNENNKHFKDYGGRGITMSDEFRNSSALFCAYLDSLPGWAPGMSIDRIDNSKGYERGNLRWATYSTQNRNRRSYGKGYHYNKQAKRWKVEWYVDGKMTYYGGYKTEAEARKKAAETCPGKYSYPTTMDI